MKKYCYSLRRLSGLELALPVTLREQSDTTESTSDYATEMGAPVLPVSIIQDGKLNTRLSALSGRHLALAAAV